jgi:amino acid transporter
LACVINI